MKTLKTVFKINKIVRRVRGVIIWLLAVGDTRAQDCRCQHYFSVYGLRYAVILSVCHDSC